MGLQLVRRERLAFKIDNQRCAGAAVEGKFGSALQIALHDLRRHAFDRCTTGPPDHDGVVPHEHFTEPKSADGRRGAARIAQLSQQALLTAEKPFAQESETELSQAAGALAGKRFGKRPAGIDGSLDLCGGTVVTETDGHLADALHREQRSANILRHQIGKIHRAPTRRQSQRDAGMTGTQLQGAHKAQVEDRLVQFRIKHLRQPIQNGRAIVPSWEVTR